MQFLLFGGVQESDGQKGDAVSGAGRDRVRERGGAGGEVVTPPSSRTAVNELDSLGRRVHDMAHSGADRMFAFLRSYDAKGRWSDKQLLEMCTEIVNSCDECGKFGRKPNVGTSLRVVRAKNARGWMDLMVLNNAQRGTLS